MIIICTARRKEFESCIRRYLRVHRPCQPPCFLPGAALWKCCRIEIFRFFSDAIREVYACIDIETLPSHLLLTLQKIIPAEVASYDEINFQKRAGETHT